ncbi:4Fe-4S dicluster domain-containing protein [Chloroflexota bacterium]
MRITSFPDNTGAAGYITGISEDTRVASINNSSIVTQEIKPELVKNGFKVINSYLNEFDVTEQKIADYWDLPRFLEKNLMGSFEVSRKLAGIENHDESESKKYVAVLGVNAVAAEDGTVFFLQHYGNILNDLNKAEKIFLIVGMDKVVKSRQDADFQTRCMGIFGMENILLNVRPKAAGLLSITDLGLPPGNEERELHIIILDNGRTKLFGGKFEDLCLCIGCRACNKHCPIQHAFTETDYIWTPKNYLSHFLCGTGNSIDVCLHCEACRLECPIDIDLPHLMWEAKIDYTGKHGRSFYHKILGMPEVLAKLGTALAPIANLLMKYKLIRVPMELVTGIDRKTVLPVFHSRTFRKWFDKNGR